jgi:hypothetical protein
MSLWPVALGGLGLLAIIAVIMVIFAFNRPSDDGLAKNDDSKAPPNTSGPNSKDNTNIVPPKSKDKDKAIPATDPHRRFAEWVFRSGDDQAWLTVWGQDDNIRRIGDLPNHDFKVTAAGVWLDGFANDKDDPLDGVVPYPTLYLGGSGTDELVEKFVTRMEKHTGLRIYDLDLKSTEFTDRTLFALTRLKSIVRLRIDGFSQVSMKGIEALKQLPNLDGLDLRSPLIDDTFANALASFSNLKVLRLSDTSIGDKTVQKLLKSGKLQELAIDSTKATGSILPDLKQCPGLYSVDLRGLNITNDDLKHLLELKNLEHLYLCHTKITDVGLNHLHECKNLKSLYLESTRTTSDAIKRLKKALPECEVYNGRDE